VSVSGSRRRSCRRGAASLRRWPRCCRCCIRVAFPATTSLKRWRVPRHVRRPVRSDHALDRPVAGRGQSFPIPGPVGRGLCLCVGRRDPRQRPPGGSPAVLAGADPGPRRRHQGADHPGRRVSRIAHELGGLAAGFKGQFGEAAGTETMTGACSGRQRGRGRPAS